MSDSTITPVANRDSAFWQSIRANLALQHQTPIITPCPRDGAPLPLSFAQERLWRVEQVHPGTTAHNLCAAFRLRGLLDVVALEHSLNTVIARHEILHTCFQVIAGQPAQIIVPPPEQILSWVDLRSQLLTQSEMEIHRLAGEEARKPFDLEHGPLWRFKLLHLADNDYVLVRTIHHLINDRWSDSLFLRELSACYEAFCCDQPPALEPLPIQYADFAIFQRNDLQGERYTKQIEYWQQRLANDPPILQLPVDFSSSAPSYQGAVAYLDFSPTLVAKLKSNFGQRAGASFFTTLLTGFLALLYRYSRQTDMVLASPVAGRYRPETRGLIGFFNNVLMLRNSLDGNPSLRELLARVNDTVAAAQHHQDLPLQDLAEILRLPDAVLSRVMFALQNVPSHPERLGNIEITTVDIEESIANFDLFLSLRQLPVGKLTAIARYKTALFQANTVTTLLVEYLATLQTMLDNPEQHLDDLLPLQASQLPQQMTTDIVHVAPRTETERCIADIWQMILKVELVGIDTNFFEAGGRSLAMVELCARLSQSFGLEIPVTGLIANPTVSSMARYLEQLTAVVQPQTTTGSLLNTAAKQKAALNRQRQLAQLRRKPNV